MSDRIKIATLLDSFKRGGVQEGVLIQSPLLDPTRFELVILSLREGAIDRELEERFRQTGLKIGFIPVRNANDTKGLHRLAQYLRRERIDILNTKSYRPNIVGRISAIMARTPAVVVNYHSTYAHRWTEKKIRYERLLRPAMTRGVCVSQTVQDFLVPLLGLDTRKLTLLHNGLNIKQYQMGESRGDLRKALGFSLASPLIACVGRLSKVKDIPTFLRAARLFLNDLPEAHFLLVGEGKNRPEMESLARELEFPEGSLSFLGSRSDIPAILNAVDCVVLTSLTEGLPRVVLEAFASRTPVVCTPSGGTVELVEDGDTGLIVPFRDPEATVGAILQTLREPEKARARCQRAFDKVQAFDLSTWVAKTQNVFESVFEEKQEAILVARRSPAELSAFQAWRRLAVLRLGYRLAARCDIKDSSGLQ